MILDTLLHNVDIVESIGDLNINIEKIHFDSRKINNNDVFVALIGFVYAPCPNGAADIGFATLLSDISTLTYCDLFV